MSATQRPIESPPVDEIAQFLAITVPEMSTSVEKTFVYNLKKYAESLQEIRRHTWKPSQNVQDSVNFDQKRSLLQKNLTYYKTEINISYQAIKDPMSSQLTQYLHDAKYITKLNKKDEEIQVLSRIGQFLGNKIPMSADELKKKTRQFMQQYNAQAKNKGRKGRMIYHNGKLAIQRKKNNVLRKRGMFEGGDYEAPAEFMGADFHPRAPYLSDDGLY